MPVTTSHQDAATKTVDVGGKSFAYRDLGPRTGTPVIFLNHLAAVLDNWDPRVVDGIASQRRVITFDNRGVGASEGRTPSSIAEMAKDAVAFIRALCFDRVDLLGFSMGGFVAQVIAEEQPDLVRKIILAGTGPAGGEGIDKVTLLTYLDVARGALTCRDAKNYLFFTETANGRSAARAFLKRLKERTENRDKAISVPSLRAHLKAINGWGVQLPRDLSRIQQAVFVANGDHDRMVPTQNSADLARRLPDARLKIYPDAGHGGIFQHHAEFVPEALDFLAA
ncbi:alpha/beta fold hydrolase [Georgenia yuyongxinii]|uniref:Alpha/beta hydrolase n=1 Tax=Georgenia yuyongxinii TaxID=2589797 RepID=A0A552WR85_9MICO|nr:alpha/beta hydrolase [Georgenia yuyongxinii]TRW45321.1 alpha/beta hydrolase [Georgenia yuyongxinii]